MLRFKGNHTHTYTHVGETPSLNMMKQGRDLQVRVRVSLDAKLLLFLRIWWRADILPTGINCNSSYWVLLLVVSPRVKLLVACA